MAQNPHRKALARHAEVHMIFAKIDKLEIGQRIRRA
jgi:hypothetical protein